MNRLTVTGQAEGVVLLPGGVRGRVVVAGALAETTVGLASAGETTSLAALVDGGDDPVDPGVAADLITSR